MRWYSTRESVRAGELTALAVVETLLAMAATAAIGLWTGSWWHLLIASLITPLMLLRTEESCVWGWTLATWFERQCTLLHRLMWSGCVQSVLLGTFTVGTGLAAAIYLLTANADEYQFVLIPVAVVGCAVASVVGMSVVLVATSWTLPAFAGRVCGAFVGLFRDPRASTAAIPRNWWKGVACTDLLLPPDLLPKPEHPDWTPPQHTFAAVLEGWGAVKHGGLFMRSEVAVEPTALKWFVANSIRIAAPLPILIPAIAVRFSLKSTALIWLPILWAIRPKKPADEPWTAHLRMFGRSDWTKAKAVLSVLTILAALAKYVLFAAEADVVAELAASASPSVRALAGLLDRFYRPNVIPIWQIVAVFNGVVFLAALFLARHWDLRNQSGLAIDERRINTVMEWLIGVTRLLAPYIILCNLWAAWHLAKKLPMPPVGSELFPWL